ncbi:hypothetical protein FKM82_002124 [Ascaphus truei]
MHIACYWLPAKAMAMPVSAREARLLCPTAGHPGKETTSQWLEWDSSVTSYCSKGEPNILANPKGNVFWETMFKRIQTKSESLDWSIKTENPVDFIYVSR